MPGEAQGERFQYRRMPAVSRRISDIDTNDIRVRILGRVVGKADGAIQVDDGTGTASVVLDEGTDKADEGGLVRLFCRVLPLEGGYELRCELVQSMNTLDVDLYRKIVG